MARNKEKHVVGLNRLWLQSLDEENAKKNPKRPGLGSLTTAAEVKKWIPSIKKDIDFCLKYFCNVVCCSDIKTRPYEQSQVACYPQSHVEQFSTRIEALTKEYKAYVRKLRELEPKTDAVPWTDRPYKRKYGSGEISVDKSVDDDKDKSKMIKSDFATIAAPILDSDDTYSNLYGYNEKTEVVAETLYTDYGDQPLVFVNKEQLSIEAPRSEGNDRSELNVSDISHKYFNKEESANKLTIFGDTKGPSTHATVNIPASDSMKLYIPYSDSSSEGEEVT